MSRARPSLADITLLSRQIEAVPELERLRACRESFAAASPDTVEAILTEAARFAAGRLDDLNAAGEQNEPRLVDGRVRVSAEHREVWRAFASGGWVALDLPEAFGGQALPLVLAVAAQDIFDRSCSAFGMLAVSTRSAVKLIARWADEAVKSEWLPKLVRGEWTATICISEAGAGSDVARIQTVAVPDGGGRWRITGEKQWISFGDHDVSNKIGHCLLARTRGAKGLSLFLVPDRIQSERNGVIVRRIEAKMGLHLSPTCALGFEGAIGILLGEEGRGLAQMFVMITNMRMATAAMGLGIASGAADIALAYAHERLQGGSGPRPVAIIEHPDVQRQLLSIHARVELLRGLVYTAAVYADLAQCDHDAERAAQAGALVQWLLPIVKTLGGETAFCVASDAMQVLGAAGYTREWPIEQALRDARVLPIFEGTTGMQALDLVRRRLWRDQGQGLEVFVRISRADIGRLDSVYSDEALGALEALNSTAAKLVGYEDRPADAEAGATAFLELAGLTAMGWIAARLGSIEGSDPASARLRSLAQFWLNGLGARAAAAAQAASRGTDALCAISVLRQARPT